MIREDLGICLHDCTRMTKSCTSSLRWVRKGDLNHPIFITYVMDASFNITPHSCNILIQLRFKIFRHVQIFSTIHFHEHSMIFFIIRRDVILPLLFTHQDGIEGKWINISLSIFKGNHFHPVFRNNGTAYIFQIFKLFPPTLSNSRASFNNPHIQCHNNITIIIQHSMHVLIFLI